MMRVVNIHDNKPYDVWIGGVDRKRGLLTSIFANRFRRINGISRELSLGLYFWNLTQHPEIVSEIPKLYGKVLCGTSYPHACHGDLLIHIAQGVFPKIDEMRWWQECTECGAPAFFWKKHITNPALYINTENPYALDYANYTHLNGTPCIDGESVRCPVCQALTSAMFEPRMMRCGTLALSAVSKLRKYR